MISVILATYNGEKFILQQIKSILKQLTKEDELIVTDNYSTDSTIDQVKSLQDNRIRIVFKKRDGSGTKNCIKNFENGLQLSKGNFIFLSDQDDIWEDSKVQTCLNYLKEYDMVVSDCTIIDNNDKVVLNSYFKRRRSGQGIIKNIYKNTYLGCCMAFKKELLEIALPFPRLIPMHDIYLGLIAGLFFKPKFIDKQLVMYRDHGENISPTTYGISKYSFFEQILFRLYLLINIPSLYYRRVFRREN